MSCVWGLLICCLAGLLLCVADQRTSSRRVQHNGEHRSERSSRKYCEPTYNNNTAGAITQRCGPGQYKERRGPYRGQCVPCNCNGLSHECDKNTGKCLNCQFNTAGDHCERCAEGYFGSAVFRTCQVCPCPFPDPSHSFALGCLWYEDQFQCLCKPGYSGTRCERCSAGYYGDPFQDGGSCQLCACDDGYLCDPLTGECENPHNPGTDGDCQVCDSCTDILMNDLERMDSELSTLKLELLNLWNSSASHTVLRKLEDAINTTKVLLMKYNSSVQVLNTKVKELQTDMDGVENDLNKLKAKANFSFSVATELIKDLDKTHHRGQDLLTDTEELLKRIEELLQQLKNSNTTVSSEEVTRILEQARQMVAQMRRQNCSVQRGLAEDELREAQKLLDYIMKNLTDPLNATLATADRIAQDVMTRVAELRDLEEALKKAEETVNKTALLNDGSEAILSDILKHRKMFEEEQDIISADLAMVRGTLIEIVDLLKMMENLTNDFAKLAAELDGAKTDLNQKLNELSKATAKEGIVRKAEEYAQYLMDLAISFEMSLLNYTNTSVVHKTVESISAYGDVIDAIKKAEAAANEAHKAAVQALVDVKAQNLTQKAEQQKDSANILLDKAKKAENDLKEATMKYDAIKDRLDKADAKGKSMKEQIQAVDEEINKINNGDINILVNQAKDTVQAANNTVSNTTARLKDLNDDLGRIHIPSGGSNVNDILSSVNNTLNELSEVFPTLTDTLIEVENQSGRVPIRTNMSDTIMRIKNMIEKTRDMANRIRGPIFFSGDSHVELRPPKNLEDLRAFTALNFTLHRPWLGQRRRRQSTEKEDNLFVLYLGNKNTLKDYVGMVIKDNVLYCVYKLGGTVYEIKTNKITRSSINSAFMDRVDFRRVYQDAKVIFTETYTSSDPKKLPPMTSQANTTVSLLDLDPSEVVLYVGGYPEDFTPPKELNYPSFRGCVEFSTLNEHILGLYNFQHAANVKNTDRCLRGEVRQVGQYFDGTGYGRFSVTNNSRVIKFFVLSRQKNALLFYMGNEDSYFTVTVEKGLVVLTIMQGKQISTVRSNKTVFPVEYYQQIQILKTPQTQVLVTGSSAQVYFNYTTLLTVDTQAFLGGVPAVIAARHNISFPPFRGCLKSLEVDVTVLFNEKVGIVPGCPVDLLGMREASLELGSSLAFAQNITQTNTGTMVSLGLKSTKGSGILLRTGKMDNGFELSLLDGHVEMKDRENILRSINRYDDGTWHYVTAFRNSTGMELSVDNTDTGEKQAPPSTTVPTDMSVVLGNETFKGCLRNFYMRRLKDNCIPADLSSFSQTGLVSLGTCDAQRPPLPISVKSSLKRRGTVRRLNVKKDSSQQNCNKPAGLIQAYHLSASSQLQYIILSEELNFRPHFSLDMRTRSTDGLLLHIADKQGVSRVVLFIANGRVKLSVGEGGLIYYQKKINNGDWHNIRFSVEQHTLHLVVDGFRVQDGQLKMDEGISLGLQAPVYIGTGQVHQPVTKTQRKPFPKTSVIGCIRDLRFYDALVGEPAVNHGGAPCFDGAAVDGAYFAGDDSYAVLEKYFVLGAEFNLTFEVHPSNATGLLFHCRGHHGRSLSVFLKKGKVVVQMNDGAEDYSTSVTLSSSLCDHTFHHVTVSKSRNVIELMVDRDMNLAFGPSVRSYSQAHDTLYIGGVPEKMHKRVPERSSFVGCMRNVQINQAALSIESATNLFGPVNINECPAD